MTIFSVCLGIFYLAKSVEKKLKNKLNNTVRPLNDIKKYSGTNE